MRLMYEWETSEVIKSFEEVGTVFLEQICKDWIEHRRNSPSYLGITICDMVWPSLKGYIESLQDNEVTENLADILCKNTTMAILPLDRMGQEQGQSSAQSVLCYFTFCNPQNESQVFYSLPVIIKRGKKTEPVEDSKISREFKGAVEISKYLRHSQTFVLPFYYHTNDYIEFLLSSSIVDYHGKSVSVTNGNIRTLMDLLYKAEASKDKSSIKHIHGILRFIYKKLRYLHCGPNEMGEITSKCELSYRAEYEKYLRHMECAEEKATFQKMWCNATNDYRTCESDCPLQLLEKLLCLSHELHVGGLHGDVHPRNIVFLGEFSHEAYLIDYGWAKGCGHIAKDYVLMECNLRYMALYPKLPSDERQLISSMIETESIENYLDKHDEQREGKTYTLGILELIMDIREEFEQTLRQLDRIGEKEEIPPDIWLYEYYIPLFLTTYGLVKFYDGCRNQIAMRETIAAFTKFLLHKKTIWMIEGESL